MAKRIVVAGSTGNLGRRVVGALRDRGASVVALVRTDADAEKVAALQRLGATVKVVELRSAEQVADACAGAVCVVSTLAGLRDVIVEAQTALLAGALRAGIARFIPSDFCTDFTKLPAGENRNFDLRREFYTRLDDAPIAASSIFNGALAEILTYNIPILNWKQKTVGYWGDADHRMDFTTMDDTAAYTSAVALDDATPRALRIASFQVSANDLVRLTAELWKTSFELVRLGSVEELRAQNIAARRAHPEGENELYSRWQQGQYMQSMFSTQHESLDNGRYPSLRWTSFGGSGASALLNAGVDAHWSRTFSRSPHVPGNNDGRSCFRVDDVGGDHDLQILLLGMWRQLLERGAEILRVAKQLGSCFRAAVTDALHIDEELTSRGRFRSFWLI